jgi:tryptophanyl-tRNA synthetase
MRPTGKLHLGNYMGALHNWVRLQNDPAGYECYFFIADLHALTTDYADPSQIKQNTVDVALDYLAAGLDPAKSVIFVQSHVEQHYELPLLLGMITPLGWLERVPSYKEMQENVTNKDLTNYGFLGYPVLMASDILLYQADFVPVGQDQTAHVELTREIARRFNFFYGPSGPRQSLFEGPEAFPLPLRQELENVLAKRGEEFKGTYFQDFPPNDLTAFIQDKILPEPEVLLTPSPKLPGTDGRKMSKSYGNTIGLTEDPQLVKEKVLVMSTNGQRPHQTDPGDPDLCPVADLHKIFSSAQIIAETQSGCRSASIGCRECKALAAKSVSEYVAPIHARRKELERDVDAAWDLFQEGSKKAQARAEETMEQVREAMGLTRGLGALGKRFNSAPSEKDDTTKRDLSQNRLFLDISDHPMDQISFHLRNYWLEELLPQDISITRDREGQLLTNKKKRVLIEAGQYSQGQHEWTIEIQPKTYDVWVLLCEDERHWLEDFVVPQKYFSADFAHAKASAAAQRGPIQVTVRQAGGDYKLSIRHDRPVDITSLRRNYAPLR